MVRNIAVVVLTAVIAFPNGISASVLTQELGGVILSSSRSRDDHRAQPSSTSTTTTTTIKFIDELDKEVIIETINYSDNTSSNPATTNSTTTTAPAINPLSSSPPSPSPVATVTTTPPSKKYEPDDDEKKDEKKKEEEQKKDREPSIGMIFLWTIVTFGLLWMSCYFSDAIMFFVGNVWINTRRYGCHRGCLQPLCPCIFGRSQSGLNGDGGATLDEIIFESEDSRTPLMA